MSPFPWRPLVIFAFGFVALFGVPMSRKLLGGVVPEIWVQVAAAAGALLLLWQEMRTRPAASRWRLLAWLGGAFVLTFLGGAALLWLIWPK